MTARSRPSTVAPPSAAPPPPRWRDVVREVRNTAAMATDPAVLAGAVVEASWLTAHLATWPMGFLWGRGRSRDGSYRIEHLAPVQRGLRTSDIEAAGTPILLVHGFISNRSVFTLLRRGLMRRGFSTVIAMNYSWLATDIREAALRLAAEVEEIVAETGYERIHIIGHSLGGLIGRYYVTRLGGDARIHTLVTLGTPHDGTFVAYTLPTRLVAQMRPGSGLLRELAQRAPGCRTRFIAYYSDADEAVLPRRSGAIRHPDLGARNVRLHGAGHIALPMLGEVVHGISSALAQLDPEGQTVVAGAVPLSRREPLS